METLSLLMKSEAPANLAHPQAESPLIKLGRLPRTRTTEVHATVVGKCYASPFQDTDSL